tara:strand:+ start:2159 stop:2755 length:597 start_codon:yes stop_codon:yes gene_type:complete
MQIITILIDIFIRFVYYILLKGNIIIYNFFKFLILLFLTTSFANSHSNKKKSLDTHIHGISTLNIAQDGKTLLFEFEMPGFDLVGFEYEAKEESDINKVENAIKLLSDYKNMISPSGSGECEIQSYEANVINDGKHSEFVSNYKFNCENISKLKIIYIKYFKSFQNGKKLNIRILGEKKKSTYVIEKSKKLISVKNHF